jgi:anti-anti-sigma factor
MLRTASPSATVPGADGSVPGTIWDTSRAARLRFEGELDSSTASEFVARVHQHLAGGVTRLVIDIDALRVVDGSGLAALGRVHDERAEQGALIIWSCKPAAAPSSDAPGSVA